MAGDKHNLQDTFLNSVRKDKNPVTVFLVNGVKLQGVITWFDNFCVLLRRDPSRGLLRKVSDSAICATGHGHRALDSNVTIPGFAQNGT